MATNQTYAITSEDTLAYLGQYAHDDADYPVTPTRFTGLVSDAASYVNVRVRAALDLTDLSELVSDTSSDSYRAVRSMVVRLTSAYVLRSSVGGDTDLADALEKGVLRELKELEKNPALLGLPLSSGGSRVSTVVDRLSLDTSDLARSERRHFDSLGARTSGVRCDHEW